MITKGLTVLITEISPEIQTSLKRFFNANNAEIIFVSKDGKKVLDTIREIKPDVVIIEPFLKYFDAIDVKHICNKEKLSPKLFFATAAFNNDKITARLLNEGFDYYFEKPYAYEVVLDRIEYMLNMAVVADSRISETERMVKDILCCLHVPSHINGYKFLIKSIELATINPEITFNITKTLYPEIARIYNTTASRVERAMRHAIGIAWENINDEIIYEYFRYKLYGNMYKPTNKEFITVISDRISMELRSKKHG